jgi:ankyrin repeat protein
MEVIDAIISQDITRLVALVENENTNVNIKGSQGRTPLHYAVTHGTIGVLETLLQNVRIE